MSSTDLMQGCKVSGQIDPKVLCNIRQVRDILQKPERKQYRLKFEFQRGRLVGFVKMTVCKKNNLFHNIFIIT